MDQGEKSTSFVAQEDASSGENPTHILPTHWFG